MKVTFTRLALPITMMLIAALAHAEADLGAVSASFRSTGGVWYVDYELTVARTADQAAFDGIVNIDRLRGGTHVSVYGGPGSIGGIGASDANCPNTSGIGTCGSNSCTVMVGSTKKSGTCGVVGTCMCKVAAGMSLGLLSPQSGDVYTITLGVPEGVTETDTSNNSVAGTF